MLSKLYFKFQPYNSGITPVENPPSFADVEKEYGIGPQPSCSKNLQPYGPLQDGFARPTTIKKLPPFSVFYDKLPAALLATQLAMFPETANSTTVKIIFHLFFSYSYSPLLGLVAGGRYFF